MNTYLPAVRSLIIRLLLLFAVVLMPLGMSPAPAQAPHDRTGSSMGHCNGQHGVGKASGIAECTMGCSVALPVSLPDCETFVPAPAVQLQASFVPAALVEQVLEIATPPPRSF